MKSDLGRFLFFLLLFGILTPVLVASGAPKTLVLGFALATGFPCLIWLKLLVEKAHRRMLDLIVTKIQAQPRPARVISVGEKRLSYGLATLLPLLLMLLTYAFDWDSKWYFIALSSGMGGTAATYLMCHNAATDEKSDV